jgi:uncharacterized protein (TIGR02646 family)
MIRINKSEDIPSVLLQEGQVLTNKLRALYVTDPVSYDNGVEKFRILRKWYTHKSVKDKLVLDQHEKYCFCEADFTANGYGDVEHYRPKKGFSLTRSGELYKPGYYWLAYDWSNLFFSCEICNRRHKKNYFPLADETTRARNHNQDYTVEQPILLHPSLDSPENYIRFEQHIAKGTDMIDGRGQTSIIGYGLNREKLNRKREEYLANVTNNIFLAKFDPTTMSPGLKSDLSQHLNTPWQELESVILTAKQFVAKAARADQPFALMVRCNFPDLPQI